MTSTWNALISALLLLTFATACGDDPRHNPLGPAGARDSILGYDLALGPLHYVDAAGHVFELLLAIGPDGTAAAGCYIVDGALFASIVTHPTSAGTDVQIYEGNRAVFRAMVTPAVPVTSVNAWTAFASASNETRDALHAWQGSASAGALAQLHDALGRLVAASASLLAPVTPKEG